MLADPALVSTSLGRTLVLVAMLSVAGAATCSWIAPARAIARPVRFAALLLLAAIALQTFGQLLAFDAWAADASPLRETLGIIGNTNWGHTRAAVVVIAVVAFAVSFTRARVLDAGVRLVAIALLAVLPLLGHAASSNNVALAYALGVAHATGAAVWLGALALLAPTWWMGLQSTVVMLPRYGRTAMFAAPTVVVSGMVTVWTRLETPMQLVSTTYGQLVLAKTVLVAAILVFGARHHRALTRASSLPPDVVPPGVAPLTARVSGARASRHTLLLELLLAALVLVLTGWLGESEPPTLE